MHCDREQQRLGGVNFYAWMCEQVFGVRPSRVRLMYLGSGEIIEAVPSSQSINYLAQRTTAVFKAVERACLRGEFAPRVSRLCDYCAFMARCPAHGNEAPDAGVAVTLAAR